jgi:biotin carboxylase
MSIMNKTLMFLGGAIHQVHVIKRAREMGIRVVLCDFNANCPGRAEADIFYNISTNDFPALLEAAKSEGVDGVLAYSADSAVITVAKLAESLQLPGYHPVQAVETLIHKDLLRSFLKTHGFSVPHSGSFQHGDGFSEEKAEEYQFPVIVKPVDASGSNGVTIVHHPDEVNHAIQNALSYSRDGRAIVEEYIDAKDRQFCGDGFIQDEKIIVHHASHQSFGESVPNPEIPIASTFPLPEQDAFLEEAARLELQRLFSLLGIKNGNFIYEARAGADDEIYILDISPRNGGDFLDPLIALAYGSDLIEGAILSAVGLPFQPSNQPISDRYWAEYTIYSRSPGTLEEVKLFPKEGQKIEDIYYLYKEGDSVYPLTSSAHFIAYVIMSFDTKEGMYRAIQHPEEWHEIALKEVTV